MLPCSWHFHKVRQGKLWCSTATGKGGRQVGLSKTASATNSQRRECVNHQQPLPSRQTASAINSQRARRKQSYTKLWRGTESNLPLRLRSKRDTTCSYTCGPSFFIFKSLGILSTNDQQREATGCRGATLVVSPANASACSCTLS